MPPAVPRPCPASPNATATAAPATVPGLPQRHGNGSRGQQPALPQGASDKTSGKKCPCAPQRRSVSRLSYLPPAVPCPAMKGPCAVRCHWPLPVSVLPPSAAPMHPAGALSPADVALSPPPPVHRRGPHEEGEPHARYPSPTGDAMDMASLL